jgi:hypothetical protein
MKRTILTLMALALTGFLLAQDTLKSDTLWKFAGATSLNVSQLSLTNWAAGGENSISGNALVNLSADYNNGKTTWDNDLILGFGLIRQGNDPVTKSDDQIDLASKVGFKASKNWSYSGLLSYKTQFAEGYDNPGEDDRNRISTFMAPGYLNISAGMDYRPRESFSFYISPVAAKMTFVLDEELSSLGVFGLDPEQTVRSEFGGYIKIAFKKEILKNVLLDTKVDLFSNYVENPQYVDVNWDLLLTFTVNKFISATLKTQMIYDYDIRFENDEARIQFKELFGIGLTYKF